MNRKKLGIAIVAVGIVAAIVVIGTLLTSGEGSDVEAIAVESSESLPTATYEVVAAASTRFIAGDEVVCGLDDQHEFIKQISGLDDVPRPIPALEDESPLGGTRYVSANIELRFDRCEMMGVLAHEVAHYILDRFHSFDIDLHLADAFENFCPGGPIDGRCADGWIIFREPHLGAEHAAHCLGNILIGASNSTNCPSEALRAAAKERIERARTLPPARQ